MKNPFRSARIFFGETVTELKKASWPTWSELRDSTLVVIVAMVLLSLYLVLADFSVFNWVSLLAELVR